MFKLTTTFRTHRFLSLAFSVTLLGILAGVVLGWSGKAPRRTQEAALPQITSRISAIQIVSAEPKTIGTSKVLWVKLRNTSDKDIKAYTVSSGKGLMTSNYFLTEESFAAGTTIDKIFPLTSDANYQVPMKGKEVVIAAVFFADGTGDGLSTYVSSMSDVYEGTRDQAKRILPCLQKLSLTSESSMADCEAEARDLPVKMNGKSSDYESGLEFTRDHILRRLDEMKENANLPETMEKQERVTKIFKELTVSSKSN